MNFGNIWKEETYSSLPRAIKECFEYTKAHDLLGFERGSHSIDGERLFVNVAEYVTTEPQNRLWEAHKHYLDVHIMLDGKEQIDLNSIENLEQGMFVEADDFLPLTGEPKSHAVLRPGDFLVLEPRDGHRTAVAVEEPERIKKAIFKVRIEQ